MVKAKKVLAVLPKGGEAAKQPDYLDCLENALGLRNWLEKQGVEYVVTADKEGDSSEFDRHLPTADIVITTPFHPAYLTPERLQKADNLELVLTAGIGSDHIDLNAVSKKGKITVAEVTGSNVVSVAEDELMRVLLLVRNFVPGYEQSRGGEWDVPQLAKKARDLEGKTVGTVGGGRIATHLMKRLQGFDCKRVYYGRHEKKPMTELGIEWSQDLDGMLAECDVVVINTPLTDKTRGMFNKERLSKMKKGAHLVNNARASIVDTDAIVDALKSGQLGGYSGDVWYPQPAPKDHPWRKAPNCYMTPHISGTTLDAQKRIAEGVREMLEQWFQGKPFTEDNYIVREGELAEQYQ
ncbi:hypothetical protein WJX72_007417 [[Myrmecia] bisecta]|uniref:Formate dehydrogenase, mitochondrial n=1 Tax=[Myrmecia] bisecta TaxID=41462 RepID=A0AAW1Q312_9CHLO